MPTCGPANRKHLVQQRSPYSAWRFIKRKDRHPIGRRSFHSFTRSAYPSDFTFLGITIGVLGTFGALSVATICFSCEDAFCMAGQACAIDIEPAVKARAIANESKRINHPPLVEIELVWRQMTNMATIDAKLKSPFQELSGNFIVLQSRSG